LFVKPAVTIALALATAALALGGVAVTLNITDESNVATPTTTITRTETVTTTTEPERAEPPVGLSDDGRLHWQLEALLHDTFGRGDFYLHYENDVARFDREFAGNCCSNYWDFLFPAASGSDLEVTDAGHQLAASQGASSGLVPLLIYDQAIACPDGTWLYTYTGNSMGTSHFRITCQYEPNND
jgi:hypothetical protein